jgi:hypothetical protein
MYIYLYYNDDNIGSVINNINNITLEYAYIIMCAARMVVRYSFLPKIHYRR